MAPILTCGCGAIYGIEPSTPKSWCRSNYTFHRRQGLALQQVLLKLDRHSAYPQPGFCAVGLKTGFFLETGLIRASLAATVSQGWTQDRYK